MSNTVLNEWKQRTHCPGTGRPKLLHMQNGTLQWAQAQAVVRAENLGAELFKLNENYSFILVLKEKKKKKINIGSFKVSLCYSVLEGVCVRVEN